MKTILKLTGVLGVAALSLLLFAGCQKKEAGGGKKYHCPMHPTYVSDRLGDCPICNMKLVPIKEGAPPPAPAPSAPNTKAKPGQYYCTMCPTVASDQPGLCPDCDMKLVLLTNSPPAVGATVKYHCPMHPTYISDKPGDCPICHMKLVPIKNGAAGHDGHAEAVPGRVTIAVLPEKRQVIGLRTATVEKRDIHLTLRANAVVEHDETRFTRIAPRFNGWVKELKVNYTGQAVEKGEPLFSVYSPDLMAGENEYLLAWRNFEQVRTNNSPASAIETARRLMESARKRLALWQISEEEIQAITARQEVKDELLFRAPFSGHVTAKEAVEGKAFMAGETLYEIADLSRVWVRAAFYEGDWPKIRSGQKARVVFPYLTNRVYESEISFLYPHIDPLTRRGEARLELDNPEHELRPDMWAQVEVAVPLGRLLVVPASAVIDTGPRQLAFVDRADGHLEPRELTIGVRTDDYWEVRAGLQEGERVVTRALFLVDAESQLKAAIAGMIAEAPAAGGTNAAPAGHKH